jgi:hypothetical protein
LLRFYEQKSLREVGDQLGLTEEAARKRVARSLDRMREFLTHRGVVFGTVGIAGILTEQTVQAAPATLAVTVLKAAVAGTSASAVLPQLARETLDVWRLAKWKLVAGIAAVTVTGIVLTTNAILKRESATPVVVTPRAAGSGATTATTALQISSSATTTEKETVTNAAVLYRQAFALYDSLTEGQRNLLYSDWRTNVLPAATAELCEKVRPILELSRQAAQLSNCDWEIGTWTFDTELPKMAAGRGVALAAVWNSARCREDDYDGIVDDLICGLLLSQRLAECRILGNSLNSANQSSIIDFLAAHLTNLVSAHGVTRLTALLDEERAGRQFYAVFGGEINVFDREADKLAAMPVQEASQYLQTKLNPSSPVDPRKVAADMQQVANLYREYATTLGTTNENPDALWQELQALQKSDPSVPLIFNANTMKTWFALTRKAAVERQMLLAGIAILQGKQDALESYPDPSSGRPFAYTQTADGFELQSTYERFNQPVKLSFR